MSIDPITLSGRLVQLEPLGQQHCADLMVAASDGELWRHFYTSVPRPEQMAAEIDRRLALQQTGSMVPFATRLVADNTVVGMTTYMNIDAWLPRLEIGSTWNATRVQGTGTNAESKLLLLGHAFDVLGCPAVELRAAFTNRQSRRAIEGIGAKLDGVLRQHSRTKDGSLRDTCVYSITAAEWPQVRALLRWRLGKDPSQGS